jgi:hypothetical protein
MKSGLVSDRKDEKITFVLAAENIELCPENRVKKMQYFLSFLYFAL